MTAAGGSGAAHDGRAAVPEAVATLRDVVVRVPERRLVGPVSWELRRGERWVVVGPNGAGKSTMLRVVGGWQYPSEGEAVVLGGRVGSVDLRDIRARVGWVSGHLDRNVLAQASVADIVLTGLSGALRRWRDHPSAAQELRARELLDLVRCADLSERTYATLSEGERQRVLIARALMADPPLLLLDEPFAGLDLAGRELLVAALDEVAALDPDRVVVLVTHHLEDVPTSFTHALLLRDGRVLRHGATAEVLTDEPVSACFGLAVRIRGEAGRYVSVARRSPAESVTR